MPLLLVIVNELWLAVAIDCRKLPMPASLLSPRAPAARLHPDHVPAELPGRPAIVAVLLDRPRVGAGADLAEHPHDSHHHDAEQRPAA